MLLRVVFQCNSGKQQRTLDFISVCRYIIYMNVKEILKSQNKSMYWLAKQTGLAYSTINDICNEKVDILDCSVRNARKICDALDVNLEDFEDDDLNDDFELFKSEICHDLKRKGDIRFLLDVLKSDQINDFYKKKKYKECYYLLAMVDYISRVNNVPLVTNFNYLRKYKLDDVIYPRSIIMAAEITHNEKLKTDAFNNSIPEFKRFNIVENEVRNVV